MPIARQLYLPAVFCSGGSAGGGEEAPIHSALLLKPLLGRAWETGWEGTKIIAQNTFAADAPVVSAGTTFPYP